MQLWLLLRRGEVYNYDEFVGFVVRAEDETTARIIATTGSGESWWSDGSATSCEPIDIDGPAGVILDSFKAG